MQRGGQGDRDHNEQQRAERDETEPKTEAAEKDDLPDLRRRYPERSVDPVADGRSRHDDVAEIVAQGVGYEGCKRQIAQAQCASDEQETQQVVAGEDEMAANRKRKRQHQPHRRQLAQRRG
jgi:hypothetical protein